MWIKPVIEQGMFLQMLGISPNLGPCKHAEIRMCLNLLGLYLNHILIQSHS